MATDFEDDLLAKDDEFQARIDDLVSSALEDQAREKRFLMEMVSAAKAALTKAEHELTSLRQVVEHRDVAVVDLLEARLAGLGTERSIEDLSVKVSMMLERPPVDELVLPITERIAELADQVGRVQSGLKPLDPWPAALEIQRMIADRVEARLKPLAEDVSEARRETLEVVRAVAAEISERMSHRMNAAEEALAGDVDVMQEAVVQRMEASLDRTSSVFHERLGEAVDHLDSGFESGVTKITDKVEALHERTSEEMGETVGHLGSALQSGLTEVSDKLEAQHERTSEKIGEAVDHLDSGIESGITELSDKLQTLQERTSEKVGEAVEHLSSGFERGRTEVSSKLEVLQERNSESISEAVDHLSSGFQSGITEVSDKLEALHERTSEKIDVSIAELAQRSEGSISALASRSEESISDLQSRVVEIHQGSTARVFDRMQQIEAEIARIAVGIGEIPVTVQTGLAELQTFTAQREQDLREAIHAFGGTIAQGEQQRSEVLAEQIARIFSTIDSYRPVVSQAIRDAMTPFAEEVRALGERIRQTNRRITESNSRLEAMHESLIAYLSMRDERLEVIREKSVIDMFDQLEETLSAKERAKLAGSMKLSRQRRHDRRDAERYRKMMAESKPVSPAERELVLEEMTQARLASKESTKVVVPPAPRQPKPKARLTTTHAKPKAPTTTTNAKPKSRVTATGAKTDPKKSVGNGKAPAPKPQRKRAV